MYLKAYSEHLAIPLPAQGSDSAWEGKAPQALPIETVHAEGVVGGHNSQQIHCGTPFCQHHIVGQPLVQQAREAHAVVNAHSHAPRACVPMELKL